jgi:hypothetical protein
MSPMTLTQCVIVRWEQINHVCATKKQVLYRIDFYNVLGDLERKFPNQKFDDVISSSVGTQYNTS